jgi:predicted component of type VI protein secretion system
MRVSLVVAAGAHEGKVIALTGPQFLIGRDQQCHLRPASPAISKLHCAVFLRDGQVYVKDFGSTNGTLVNDEVVQGAEVPVEDGASLRVGPLEFRVRVERAAARPDGTPLPSPESAAALAAVKAAEAAKAPPRDATPSPVKPRPGAAAQPAAKPAAPKPPASRPGVPNPLGEAVIDGPAEVPALGAAGSTTSESVADEKQDRMAAMLLGMDDDGNGSVPDGSTVMDVPTPLAGAGDGAKPGEKKDDDKPKKAQTREEMSSAANDLLRKYMRRPR